MVIVRLIMTIPARSSPVASHVSGQVELERFGWVAVARDSDQSLNLIGECTHPTSCMGSLSNSPNLWFGLGWTTRRLPHLRLERLYYL